MNDKNKSINNKGFTLIELLATIAILAVIMLLAIPNIVGVVQRSRNKTYVEDAKKLVSLAKYKMKTDIDLKAGLEVDDICISITDLDKSGEIKDAPNGGTYNMNASFVKVKKESENYTYKVQLIDNNNQGLELIDSIELAEDDAYSKVKSISNPTHCSN